MDKVVDITSAIKKYKGFWKQVFSIIFFVVLVVFNVKVLGMEAGGAFILTLAEAFCATYFLL